MIMNAGNETPAVDEMTVDQRVNRAIRALVERQGTTVTELGRRLRVPYSSWARKISDRADYHHKYSAEEIVRISAALGVTANDLLYDSPVLGSTEE